MTTNVPERSTKRADQLAPGDRIPGDWLPTGEAGEVLFRWKYAERGREWVLVVYVDDKGIPDAYPFLGDKPIPVETVASVPDGVAGEALGDSGPDRHTDPKDAS